MSMRVVGPLKANATVSAYSTISLCCIRGGKRMLCPEWEIHSRAGFRTWFVQVDKDLGVAQ